jgi:hypothetical protein
MNNKQLPIPVLLVDDDKDRGVDEYFSKKLENFKENE